MNVPFDPIALTLVPSIAFAVAAMWHFCVLTKDHKRSWVVPGSVALAIGVAGTFQAAAFQGATPVDFVRHGAFYSPIALRAQAWRWLTSIFLYDDPVLVLFSALVVAIVGCRLVQHVGVRGFVFTFVLANFFGATAAAAIDPQSIVAGATGGAFGLVTATLLFGGWRASEHVERIARACAVAFVIVTLARLIATDHLHGTLNAVGGIVAAFFVWITYRQATPHRRAFVGTGIVGLAVSSTLMIPTSTDLIGLAESTHRKELETWARLAGLESARTNKWIDDGEFAERLDDEVLGPLGGIIDASTEWSLGQTKWIVDERDRLYRSHARLSVLREILRSKQILVDAEAAADEATRMEKLDAFWAAFPDAKREIAMIPVQDVIKEGAAYDLTLLRQTANDLEIWSLETALAELREQVVEDGPRTPASTLPWNEIRESWNSRRMRLERLSPDTPEQIARVDALKERLARAIEAIQ